MALEIDACILWRDDDGDGIPDDMDHYPGRTVADVAAEFNGIGKYTKIIRQSFLVPTFGITSQMESDFTDGRNISCLGVLLCGKSDAGKGRKRKRKKNKKLDVISGVENMDGDDRR
jgi:hypothetical protein